MRHITVRRATLDNALAIANIHVASWQHAYRGILPDAYLDALSPNQRLPMWTSILTSPESPTHVGVAEAEGQVLGFYSVGRSDEGHPAEVQMLYTLYMHPASMGKGVGRMLMADAEQQMMARGAGFGVLRVLTANEPTLRFYERCGWSPEPGSVRIEDAWGQQVETVRYTKQLVPDVVNTARPDT